jgi:hypothetical protein
MLGPVLEFEDLKRITRYERLSDVERCLDRAGVRFFRCKDGIWTTIDLVNQAGGLRPAGDGNEPYSPELAA